MPPFGRADPAVVEAMRQAIDETAETSSKTIGFVVWRATQILVAREDAQSIEVPSRRTLYRLFDRMATGTHATGSAATRRSVNARPAGPFGEVPACAPGEWMRIDSTPLDVLVRLDDGIAEKDGPAKRSKRDRRVAARTRATAIDRPVPNPSAAEPVPDDEADTRLAKVIPLGLFDPLANPWRRT